MSNVLKPLVWKGAAMANITHFEAQGAGIFYRINKIDGNHVVVWHDQSEGSSGSKELKNLEEAKSWAEFTHYPSKMQPYINNPQTWIDASKQLPQVDKDTQFICAYDSAIEPFSKVVWLNADIGEFNYQHDNVLAWMPIPEFSTMHKGGDCE